MASSLDQPGPCARTAEDAALLASDPYGFAAAIYEGLLSYFDMAPLKE